MNNKINPQSTEHSTENNLEYNITNALLTVNSFLKDSVYPLKDDKNFQNALRLYITLFEHTRTQFNMMGNNQLIAKHIIDSLSPLSIFIEHALTYRNTHNLNMPITFADLGSGGGLPGIPLALAFSAIKIPSKWYLVERSRKKVNFLQKIISSISPLVIDTDIFVIASTLKEWHNPPKINFITTRAFRTLHNVIKDMKTLSPTAELLLYKGKTTTLLEEFQPWISKQNFEKIVLATQTTVSNKTLSQPIYKNNATSEMLSVEKIYPLFHEPGKERHLLHAKWN